MDGLPEALVVVEVVEVVEIVEIVKVVEVVFLSSGTSMALQLEKIKQTITR